MGEADDLTWTPVEWPPITCLVLPDGTIAREREPGVWVTEDGDVYTLESKSNGEETQAHSS